VLFLLSGLKDEVRVGIAGGWGVELPVHVYKCSFLSENRL